MRILTCNIRYYDADDKENAWSHRKDICLDVIRSRSPHVICLQEVWAEQFLDLQSAFGEFEAFGIALDVQSRDPVNTILYRRDLFKRVSAGGYWLSETPHVAGSSSWESACVRLANWVRLDVVGLQKELRILNTHLDHVSQTARERQAQLINEDACVYPKAYPQILTGDMNCNSTNKAMSILREGGWKDTFEAAHGMGYPGETYHHFLGDDDESDRGKIDWIFFKGRLNVVGAEVIKDSQDGRFPSDHYFVSCDFEL